MVGNLVSGVFIVTDPTFNIGDWIRWNDKEGVIKDIRFRSTRVRTFDNEVIAVPNSELTANAVTNTVLNGRLRLTVPVRVDYGDDLDAVVRILSEVAADHPDVLERPEPIVRVTDLGETVEVVASLWIAEPDRITYGRIRSEYAREIVNRLKEAGDRSRTDRSPGDRGRDRRRVEVGAGRSRSVTGLFPQMTGSHSGEPATRTGRPDAFSLSSPRRSTLWSTRWYTPTTSR